MLPIAWVLGAGCVPVQLLSEDSERIPDIVVNEPSRGRTVLAEGNGGAPFSAKLCTTDSGHVYATWLHQRADDESPVLWATRSLDRGRVGTWLESPIRVAQELGADQTNELACDDDGGYLMWTRQGEQNVDVKVMFARWEADQPTPEAPVTVDDDEERSVAPRFAVSGSLVVVAWGLLRPGSSNVLVRASLDRGFTWLPITQLDAAPLGEGDASQPDVAVRPDANAVAVAWMDAGDGSRDIYATLSLDGGRSFAPETRLDGGDLPGEAESWFPRLCGNQDQVVVMWADARDRTSGSAPYLNRADAWGSWLGEAMPSSSLGPDDAGLNGRLACTFRENELLTAWVDVRSGDNDLWVRQGLERAGEPEVAVFEGVGGRMGPAADAGYAAVGWFGGRYEGEAAFVAVEPGQPWPEASRQVVGLDDSVSGIFGAQLSVVGDEALVVWVELPDGRVVFESFAIGE